jgi:hypothetical protein
MYHGTFDDFKRRLAKSHPEVELKVLNTSIVGTPDYDAYLGVFLLPENKEVEVTYDGHVATFYRIETKKKEIINV